MPRSSRRRSRSRSRCAAVGSGLAVSEFDVVSGLAGIRASTCSCAVIARRVHAVTQLLEALVELVSRDIEPADLSRRLTPVGRARRRRDLPTAHLHVCSSTAGSRNGIPGSLAVMALAPPRMAWRCRGCRAQRESRADWSSPIVCDDAWGINWPAMVTLRARRRRRTDPRRVVLRQPRRRPRPVARRPGARRRRADRARGRRDDVRLPAVRCRLDISTPRPSATASPGCST